MINPEINERDVWLDYCDANDLDPEEELFYERADYEHDRGREDKDDKR